MASMYVLNTFPWERLEVVELAQPKVDVQEPEAKRQKIAENQGNVLELLFCTCHID